MTKARILADYVAGGTTAAEFDYMDGVTSNVQTQLTAKAPLASPTFTGTTTVSGDLVPSTALSNRNMVINGGMQVAQRGTNGSNAGYQTVDRMSGDFGYVVITQSQETLTSGSPYDLGFRKSMKHLTTNNVTGTNTYFSTEYKIEAQDIASSGWNYKSASSYITLSFWVKIAPAGTYHTMVKTDDGTKYWYAKQYTVLADTWTKVEMSVPGNSNLTINNDNGKGLTIYPFVAYGTDYTASSSAESWTAYSGSAQTFESAGVPNWLNTTNAYVEFTGIQLEQGSNATPFEHRSFADELARCQRYYFQDDGHLQGAGYQNDYYHMDVTVPIPVPMRAQPTATTTGGYIWRHNGYVSAGTNPPIAVQYWEAYANNLYLKVSGVGWDSNSNGYVCVGYFNDLFVSAEL